MSEEGKALCHQGNHRHQGTVTQRKLIFPAPHLPKQHIVVELCKLRGKIPQRVPARRQAVSP